MRKVLITTDKDGKLLIDLRRNKRKGILIKCKDSKNYTYTYCKSCLLIFAEKYKETGK